MKKMLIVVMAVLGLVFFSGEVFAQGLRPFVPESVTPEKVKGQWLITWSGNTLEPFYGGHIKRGPISDRYTFEINSVGNNDQGYWYYDSGQLYDFGPEGKGDPIGWYNISFSTRENSIWLNLSIWGQKNPEITQYLSCTMIFLENKAEGGFIGGFQKLDVDNDIWDVVKVFYGGISMKFLGP